MYGDGGIPSDRMEISFPDISDSSTCMYTEECGMSPLDTWRSASSETHSVIEMTGDHQVPAVPLALITVAESSCLDCVEFFCTTLAISWPLCLALRLHSPRTHACAPTGQAFDAALTLVSSGRHGHSRQRSFGLWTLLLLLLVLLLLFCVHRGQSARTWANTVRVLMCTTSFVEGGCGWPLAGKCSHRGSASSSPVALSPPVRSSPQFSSGVPVSRPTSPVQGACTLLAVR